MNKYDKQDQTRLADRLAQLDGEVRQFAIMTRHRLRRKVAQEVAATAAKMGIREREAYARRQARSRAGRMTLRDSIRYGLRKSDGTIDQVYFSFARHGIFYEHGVGAGRAQGSAEAEQNEHPWLSVVLPAAIDELADLIAEKYADIATSQIRIVVPGIIDTNVK